MQSCQLGLAPFLNRDQPKVQLHRVVTATEPSEEGTFCCYCGGDHSSQNSRWTRRPCIPLYVDAPCLVLITMLPRNRARAR